MVNQGKTFIVKTPDGNFIRFKVVTKTEINKIFEDDSKYKLLPADKLDLYGSKAYLLADGQIAYEKNKVDSIFYAFEDMSNYLSALKGKDYYEAGLNLNGKDGEICSSFNLRPNVGKIYFKNKKLALDKYPMFDGYVAYLMSDNSIAFLRHRINDLYDGYWYPTIRDFEYSYYSLTTE